MDPLKKRKIGNTNIEVTQLGFGGTSLGNMYKAISEQQGLDVLSEAFRQGVRYFDVAPFYGYGRSERIMGTFFQSAPRDEFVVSTKVGRLIVENRSEASVQEVDADIFKECDGLYSKFDYSRDGVLRSLEESLKRLKLDRVDILHIHDPDVEDCFEQALNETFPTLAKLREQKVIGAVSAGMNQAEMLTEFAKYADFDCFLLAGRYTLLDQIGLVELLPLCERKKHQHRHRRSVQQRNPGRRRGGGSLLQLQACVRRNP